AVCIPLSSALRPRPASLNEATCRGICARLVPTPRIGATVLAISDNPANEPPASPVGVPLKVPGRLTAYWPMSPIEVGRFVNPEPLAHSDTPGGPPNIPRFSSGSDNPENDGIAEGPEKNEVSRSRPSMRPFGP